MEDEKYYDMEFIRERISQLRVAANLSQRKLSEYLGNNESYIKEISAGRSNPSLEALLNICEYFKITPMEFFNDELREPLLAREIYHELSRICNKDMGKMLDILRVTTPQHFSTFVDFMNRYRSSFKK